VLYCSWRQLSFGRSGVVTSFYSKEKADLNFYIFSPFSTQDSGGVSDYE